MSAVNALAMRVSATMYGDADEASALVSVSHVADGAISSDASSCSIWLFGTLIFAPDEGRNTKLKRWCGVWHQSTR